MKHCVTCNCPVDESTVERCAYCHAPIQFITSNGYSFWKHRSGGVGGCEVRRIGLARMQGARKRLPIRPAP